jgi:hypothetical protein
MPNDDNVFTPVDDNAAQKPDLDSITLETLVGEGQKYADPTQLAKAYVSADYTIDQQKSKIAELEARSKVLNDLLESNKPVNNNDQNKPDDKKPEAQQPRFEAPPVNKNDGVTNGGNSPDLSELVRQELAKANEQQSFKSNVETAAGRLTEQYGSAEKAKDVVNAKAKELGVSVDWLLDAAGRSPSAFYATMGLNSSPSLNTPVSQSDNNIRVGSGNKKDYKYFEGLRKASSKQYYSAQVQRELFQARTELGEAFYN